jgi:hypothetical protein
MGEQVMSEMTEDKVNELITSALANYAKKIELRVVSDEKGGIVEGKGTIQARDMYTFYVRGKKTQQALAENGTPKKDEAGNPIYEEVDTGIPVKMVLPVGGELSGLYHFPRVGEKVLVQLGGGTDNYLLGYVPGEETPFIDTSQKTNEEYKLLDKCKGMVLRRKNTNSAQKTKFSEIGLRYNPALMKDQIDIKSAGNIYSKAEDHHMLQAGRFDIDAWSNIEEKNRIDLEVPGDTSNLEEGCIQIRANGSVVINAAVEITLRCGRTIVSISDSGFDVTTKMINSNWKNTHDTNISMNPRTGISMTGQTVGINAVREVSMADSFGGSFASSIGIASVMGREVSIDTLKQNDYIWTTILNSVDLAVNIITAGLARGGVDPGKAQDIVKELTGAVKKGAQLFRKITKIRKKVEIARNKEKDRIQDMKKVLDEKKAKKDERVAKRETDEKLDKEVETYQDSFKNRVDAFNSNYSNRGQYDQATGTFIPNPPPPPPPGRLDAPPVTP